MTDEPYSAASSDERMQRYFSLRGLRWSNRAIPVVVLGLSPLAGVFLLGWNTFELLLAYASENLLVGALMAAMLVLCRRHGPTDPDQPELKNKHIVAVTALLYFMTCGHILLISFMARVLSPEVSVTDIATAALPGLIEIVYGFVTFLRRREYTRTTPAQAVVLPWRRLVAVHFTLLGTGLLIAIANGGGVWALVLVKAPLDVILYLREHTSQEKPKPELKAE